MDWIRDLLAEYDVLGAFWMTIKLAVFSAVGAWFIGTFVAILRVSPVGVLRCFGTAYVNIIRNTPLTLIMFFCSFGLSARSSGSGRPGVPDLDRRQQLPLGVVGARGLPRVVRRRGAPLRHQHRAPGSGRGRPGDRVAPSFRRCE